MHNNGVSHNTAPDDLSGVYKILETLAYVPAVSTVKPLNYIPAVSTVKPLNSRIKWKVHYKT